MVEIYAKRVLKELEKARTRQASYDGDVSDTRSSMWALEADCELVGTLSKIEIDGGSMKVKGRKKSENRQQYGSAISSLEPLSPSS